MTQDKLMLGYNSKILTNMYGMSVISDQCLRIILTILCPNMISTGIIKQAVVKYAYMQVGCITYISHICLYMHNLHISYMH